MEFPTKRSQTKENNRRVILDAARGVFGRYGYRRATVRDIIGATSLASGTFYNYFKSKEDVFAALRDEMALQIRPLLRSERQRAGSADAFVFGTFRAFLSHVAERTSSFDAINAREDQTTSASRMIVMGADDLRRDLEAAVARGLFAEVDTELLAAAIVGVAFEVGEVIRKRECSEADRTARFCSELILRGVACLPTGADVRI